MTVRIETFMGGATTVAPSADFEIYDKYRVWRCKQTVGNLDANFPNPAAPGLFGPMRGGAHYYILNEGTGNILLVQPSVGTFFTLPTTKAAVVCLNSNFRWDAMQLNIG